MVLCCFIIPVGLLSNRKTRKLPGILVASACVLVGMWLERFTIVLPTLVNPRLPYERGVYSPSWIEVAITAGCFACFMLVYILFVKIFPIISIWEIKQGQDVGVEETVSRIENYLPESAEA
jgi:molybdopterin-containing oxidoreductase family membrane subunit